ncbi:MAG: HEAT repeat domain-containing protein [Anaerolineales bacterium]
MNDDNIIRFDDTQMPDDKRYTVQDALAALPIKPDELVPPAIIFGFSGMRPDDVALVGPVWRELPEEQRVIIMERLAEQSEADYMVDYEVLARMAYTDPVPAVRVAALNANWADESLDNMQQTATIAHDDPAYSVRAAAFTQVSKYLYLAEIGELDQDEVEMAKGVALQHATDAQEHEDVRRLALEALAHTSHPQVAGLIENASATDDPAEQASALRAMGHTCDERWNDEVLDGLNHAAPEVSLAAIFAAGNIGLEDAVEPLQGYIHAPEEEHRYIAVWALGEIGSEDALRTLADLLDEAAESDDDEWLEAIEEALENARMMLELKLTMDMEDDDD